MRLLVFGLSMSSAWANGHATLWRGLLKGLARLGHHVTFYERDTPYYAAHRDCTSLPSSELRLYTSFDAVASEVKRRLREVDVAMVTSFCPDGRRATACAMESSVPRTVFYDLDTPITLQRMQRGEDLPELTARGLRDFDLVLSYVGGTALGRLREELGAKRVAPLYGSVDPEVHRPCAPKNLYRADLSYLGTYAEERQEQLERLFLAPARALPRRKFVLAGSQYPADFPWTKNTFYLHHVPPSEHAAFYGSAGLNLNVTRAPMAASGYCPSGRLFEAAASGGTIISDAWQGLDAFYTPGDQILLAESSDDVLLALQLSHEQRARIAARARERTLSEHTVDHRARQLVDLLESVQTAPRDAALQSSQA